MTSLDLCRTQCAVTAKQLDRVYSGMSESTLDAKLYDDFVSPRECVTHLAECTVALGKSLRGEKHGWGSFSLTATDFDGQMAEYQALRSQALDDAFAIGTDEAVEHVMSYITLHDAYHVGQLCALRAKLEGWDTESIYG